MRQARFRQEFERNLAAVLLLYRHADVESTSAGIVLRPSKPAVPARRPRRQLTGSAAAGHQPARS